ncbi:hypothetical protein RU10_12365 [Pseudomonas fluorescens]|uniref:Uncharacterized protein n=2 Tax=Pseudomonas fluorescens TaxID=294 RepID=A0AAE2AW67_PSEFL|nr:hypothetical protein RU10_12365 [Pseudomonas fluorescens]
MKEGLLKKKLHEILLTDDDDNDIEKYRLTITNRIFHSIVYGGIESRKRRGALTGEWLIYYVYNGLNYYLDLADHEVLNDQQKLYDRLSNECAWEFPFAFAALT